MNEGRLDRMLDLYKKYHSDEILIDMIIELRNNFLDHDLVSKQVGFDISDATVVNPLHVIFYIAEYIDILEKKVNNLQENYKDELEKVDNLHDQYIDVNQQKNTYRNALEFYAKRENYLQLVNVFNDIGFDESIIQGDGGETARQVLEGELK